MKLNLEDFKKALKNNDVSYVLIQNRCLPYGYIQNDTKDWNYKIYKKDSASHKGASWTGDQISGYARDVMYDVFETLNIPTK